MRDNVFYHVLLIETRGACPARIGFDSRQAGPGVPPCRSLSGLTSTRRACGLWRARASPPTC